jgi:4'-phosphopantetheinyl transferase
MGPNEVAARKPRDNTLDDVAVWIVRLRPMGIDTSVSASPLSPDERRRARRFRFAADRSRYATTHSALRAILGAYLGVAPARVCIRTDPAGKPHLDARRHRPPLHFSLSHAGELALIAVSDREVGVDIEQQRAPSDADALVLRYFSSSERAAYFALPRAERARAFMAAWTVKEAYLKACGAGLSRGLDSFSVAMRPDEPAQLLAVHDRPGEEARWRVERLAPARGYVAALAVESR